MGEGRTTYLTICRCKNKWRCQCLLAKERKAHPPFNTSVELGNNVGLHPKFFPQNVNSPDVGLYDPREIQCSSKGISWTMELNSADFSRKMGGRMLEKYGIQRDIIKRGRGPGVHEIIRWPENICEKVCENNRKDVGFGTVPLFKPSYASTTPGPGYTPLVHNPYYYLDESRKSRGTCVPSFEFDGLQPRFRDSYRIRSWSLPCTRYNVKYSNSLNAFLKKQTGKRGPYDLFTGPRNASTIKGYWAQPKIEDRGDWPKDLPRETDRLFHKSNIFKGKWTTCPRFTKKPSMRMMLTDIGLCYKDPNQPGPATYNPKSPRKPRSRSKYPFDSCIENVRPQVMSDTQSGPGRYRIKATAAIPGHGWTWVFKSKVGRVTFAPKPVYNSF